MMRLSVASIVSTALASGGDREWSAVYRSDQADDSTKFYHSDPIPVCVFVLLVAV